MTERDIQDYAVKEWRGAGFEVLITSNRKITANTRGLPDAFIWTQSMYWIGVDFKSPTGGYNSDKQRELAETGKILIVRTTAETDGITKELKRRFYGNNDTERLAINKPRKNSQKRRSAGKTKGANKV